MDFWDELKSRLSGALNPDVKFEAGWKVEVSDGGVTCTRPTGEADSVAWDDLKAVTVITTDEGPFAPDVLWHLEGGRGGCVVPQGAAGEDALLERLQALPGFDNEALVEAMSSAENRRFVCWKKESAK
jgi:hypothetical protein